jgi:hypothetical protein
VLLPRSIVQIMVALLLPSTNVRAVELSFRAAKKVFAFVEYNVLEMNRSMCSLEVGVTKKV